MSTILGRDFKHGIKAKIHSSWFDFGMSFTSGSLAWRLPLAAQSTYSIVLQDYNVTNHHHSVIFAVGVIFLVFGLPESPRWLFNRDRSEEAIQVLCTIYDKPSDDPLFVYETGQIVEAIELEDRNGRFKWRNIFKRDSVQTGRRVQLAWGVQCMNQIGGINLVVYYIPSTELTSIVLRWLACRSCLGTKRWHVATARSDPGRLYQHDVHVWLARSFLLP